MDDIGPLHPLEKLRPPHAFASGPDIEGPLAEMLAPCLDSLCVEPLCAYAWTGRAGWQLEPRVVADSMWFYFSAGCGQGAVGEDAAADDFCFGPGSLILVPAGTLHWLKLTHPRGMRMYTVHFHARVLEGFEALHYLGFPAHWRLPRAGDCTALCECLAREHALGLPGGRRRMEVEILAFLLQLVRADPARLRPRFKGFHRAGFGSVRKFMHWAERKLADPQAAVSEAAAETGVSDSYLRRVLRTNLGVGPRRYLLQRRLERSLLLLRTTAESVDAIAIACGFADPSYFHRAFRRRYQTTPLAYRRTVGR